MKNKLLFITLLLFSVISCFGQKHYIYSNWKSKEVFQKNEIVFQIDTTGSADDIKVLLVVANKIDDNIKANGIHTKPIPFPNDTLIAEDVLCLKLEMLDLAYVKLNTFERKIPLCFRVRMSQTQPQSKRLIQSEISVSIDNKLVGIEEMGVAIANDLTRHFNINK